MGHYFFHGVISYVFKTTIVNNAFHDLLSHEYASATMKSVPTSLCFFFLRNKEVDVILNDTTTAELNPCHDFYQDILVFGMWSVC